MWNDTDQGLQHSLLRHSSEWKEVIQGFEATVDSFSSTMKTQLDTIGKNAFTLDAVRNSTWPSLNDEDMKTVSKLQISIYEFLRNNVTYAHLLRGHRSDDEPKDKGGVCI
ncbi:unnamed protein product, partial [Mesorhabditis belari]|uniref:Uncharacterized protein n=1 Tax=Mesorhabditis belari TaxID=2138241 RepID=A0AAF3F1W9_9BILA